MQGISFLFCGIDAAGDVCSGISVCTCDLVPRSDCVMGERREGSGEGRVVFSGMAIC